MAGPEVAATAGRGGGARASATAPTEVQRGHNGGPRAHTGVQSLSRAFAILEAMADAQREVSLSRLAAQAQLPPATIHRMVRTLVDLGYVRQGPSRQYSLGPRLMRLVDLATKRLGTLARAHMQRVVDALGESVNLAVLDGSEVVYIEQVQPSQNFMRMFTEVGSRVKPHATAVGKAILATKSDVEVRELVEIAGMPSLTERTITTPERLLADLREVRARGYALDNGEQELGVRCVAVAIQNGPRPLALSMSGPLTRMGESVIERAAPALREAAEQIEREFQPSLAATDS